MKRLLLPLAILAVCLTSSFAQRPGDFRILGPGGGGAMFHPLVSPHDTNTVLIACDMTGSYITHDGGQTWSDTLTINPTYNPTSRIHFWDSNTGVAMSFAEPNYAFRTTTGGLALTDWSRAEVDPNGGWFGAQFSALPNGHMRISGITFCESLDYAATFNCRPSIDAGSDFATFFLDDERGWVGGGWISVPMMGYIHRTLDGGKTWSDRVLEGPWMIREILFVNKHDGWAAGGAGNVGGVYVSHDGGENWAVELNTQVGLTSCATAEYHLYCAGFDDNGTSHFYARDYDKIRDGKFDP